MVLNSIIIFVIIGNNKIFNAIFNNVFVGNSDFVIRNVMKNGIKNSTISEKTKP